MGNFFGKSQQSRMEEEALKEAINAPRVGRHGEDRSKPSPRHNPNLHGPEPEPEEERSVITILKIIAAIFIVIYLVMFFQADIPEGVLPFVVFGAILLQFIY